MGASLIKLGDLVHMMQAGIPPAAGQKPYFSRATNQAAIGIVVDMVEREDGFYYCEVLCDGELGWWPDIQLKLIED